MPKNINNEINILIKKFESKRFEEVINKSIILLKKNDNDFLWNLLGLSFQNLNQIKKSIDCFENAINLNQKNFSALNNLGLSHKKIKNYLEAEEYLLKSIELNPNYLNALVNLGNIKNETYFFEESIMYYEKAIKLNNKTPLIFLNISNVYQTINQIEQAKKYLEEAILIDETFTVADQKLSMLEKYHQDHPHLLKMLDKLENLKLTDYQKVSLYFGLYKAFKDIKDYNKSFYYLKIGNSIQRNLLKYDISIHKSLSKKIKDIFSKLNLKNYVKSDNGKNYIFVLGMPRSGTTLIEKIISSHPKASTISESNFIPEKVIKYIYTDLNNLKKFLDTDFQNEYEKFIKLFNIKKDVIVDKTLSNFWYIGFIKIFFPKSTIIHVSRNPKDNCLSIYENLFDYPEGWHSQENELAEYYLIYKDIMKFWHMTFKNQILDIKYEDLINDSEKKIKEIIKFCNLDWDVKCLDFYSNNNPIKTLSVNQANKPIYKSSIDKSKIYQKELETLFSKLN